MANDAAILFLVTPMSNTISIEQASLQLAGLVRGLGPDDEIILTDNDKPIARIVLDSAPRDRVAGTCKGMLEIIDDDDDEVILDHFKEYVSPSSAATPCSTHMAPIGFGDVRVKSF